MERNPSLFQRNLIWIVGLIYVLTFLFFRFIIALKLAERIFMVLIIGPIPNARYRLAALAFIILPAAYALQSVLEKQTFYKKGSSML